VAILPDDQLERSENPAMQKSLINLHHYKTARKYIIQESFFGGMPTDSSVGVTDGILSCFLHNCCHKSRDAIHQNYLKNEG